MEFTKGDRIIISCCSLQYNLTLGEAADNAYAQCLMHGPQAPPQGTANQQCEYQDYEAFRGCGRPH